MTTIDEILIIYSNYRFIASYMSLLSGLLHHDHACSRSSRSLPSSTMSLARGVTSKKIPDANCRFFLYTRKLKRCVSLGNDAVHDGWSLHHIGFHTHASFLALWNLFVRLLHCKPSQKLDCKTKAVFWTFLSYNE